MPTDHRAELVSYCGLYCGDCHGYAGTIADLARDLRKELRRYKFDRFAAAMPFKEFENYPQCYATLGAMVKLRCRKACRGGGGPPFCKIRRCCLERDIPGCWECDDFEECDFLRFLEPVHADAHIKNLRRIRKIGPERWMVGKRYW